MEQNIQKGGRRGCTLRKKNELETNVTEDSNNNNLNKK